MTAAFYNPAQHPRYGAAELKRLAGKHTMYSLFLSVGVVGAVFLVLNLFPEAKRSVVIALPPTVVNVFPKAPEQPVTRDIPPSREAGGSSRQGVSGNRVAPVVGTTPVVGTDILPVDMNLDIPIGGNDDNPLGGGDTKWGGNSRDDVIPNNGGITDQLGGEEEDEWVQIPDVMPSFDEALLQSNVEYPAMARLRGMSGKVVVAVLIDERGRATAVSVASSTSEMFNQAALDAVAKVKFSPAYRNKQPVQFRLYVPIEFKMK